MIRMPGRSFQGPLPPLTENEATLRDELRRTVEMLAVEIGERNAPQAYEGLQAAREYLELELRACGYEPRHQEFEADGRTVANIDVELTGFERPDEILIVGAHYDTTLGGPGANDNGSGVAAALELARFVTGRRAGPTVRFVFFTNEEGPYFKTSLMGSRVYARACRARGEHIIGMINLDTIGCFIDGAGSQRYPPPLGLGRPATGDYIAFIGHYGSIRLTRRLVRAFRRHARIPSEGMILPGTIPGSGFSDQWSFWMEGYPGVLVTDTGPFRHPQYHTADDLPQTMDFDRLTRVVAGLQAVADRALLNGGGEREAPVRDGSRPVEP